MKKYRQLTFEDRIYIEACRWQGVSFHKIAARLRVHASTVEREFRRGATGWLEMGYRADLGQKKSPEQISGRFKLDKIATISHATIYRFIKKDRDAGGDLYLYLRHGRRRRKKRFSVACVRSDILARKSIHTRPEIINERRRTGDWERDLMFASSRSSALMTFVERKTKFTLIRPVRSKSPREIAMRTLELMSQTKYKPVHCCKRCFDLHGSPIRIGCADVRIPRACRSLEREPGSPFRSRPVFA